MFIKYAMIAAMLLLATTPSMAGEITLDTDGLYASEYPVEYKKQEDGSILLGNFPDGDKVTLTTTKGEITICMPPVCRYFQKNAVLCLKENSKTVCR